jgi:hypothetical protein
MAKRRIHGKPRSSNAEVFLGPASLFRRSGAGQALAFQGPRLPTGRRPQPTTPAGWRREIRLAFDDALEAVAFMDPRDQKQGADVLFHLAPHVAVKFRGAPARSRSRAVKGALASYIASQSTAARALRHPYIAFAFCYLAAHLALGLVEESEVTRVMDYLEGDGP